MKTLLTITLLVYLITKEIPQVQYPYDMGKTVAVYGGEVYQLETIR